jgi:hypothetical protein
MFSFVYIKLLITYLMEFGGMKKWFFIILGNMKFSCIDGVNDLVIRIHRVDLLNKLDTGTPIYKNGRLLNEQQQSFVEQPSFALVSL